MPTDIDLPLEIIGGARALLGESPFWDHGDCIWWVDITDRKLVRTTLSTGSSKSWTTPELPGFVVLAGPDRPFIGMERGIYSFSPASGAFNRILISDAPGQRFNDATIDETGRLWASTLAIDGTRGRGALHCVTSDLSLVTVIDGLTTPNGLAADTAGSRLFLSDSHPDIQTIWSVPCDFRSGTLGFRDVFATTHHLGGRPDGAALASDSGLYWIAGVDGSALYGFTMDGALEKTVRLSFPAPTKLALSARGIAITAKGEGGYGGELAIARNVPPCFRGRPVPFWQLGVGE